MCLLPPPQNPDDNEPIVEPFYLYDGAAGVNKLGEIVLGGQNALDTGTPVISMNNNYIEATLKKELYCNSTFPAKKYDFGIDNIDKYSNLAIEYELVSGKIHNVQFGYVNSKYGQNGDIQVGTNCTNLIEDDNNKYFYSIYDNIIIGNDIDSIHYTRHIDLNKYNGTLRNLLMGKAEKYPPTQYRLGFCFQFSDNKVIDTVFRIYKIWLE